MTSNIHLYFLGALEDFNKSSTLEVKDDDGVDTASKSVLSNKTEDAASKDADNLWIDFINQISNEFSDNLIQNGNYIYIYVYIF